MRKKRILIGLAVVNLFLAALLFSPLRAQFFSMSVLSDCCKDNAPEPYCCLNCCFFVNDCDEDEDCQGG